MSRVSITDVIGLRIFFCIFVGGIVGWVWNIIKLMDADMVLSGLIIVRIIGVFVPPVGAIVGYL